MTPAENNGVYMHDIVCDCECHSPIGYRLRPGQTPPPVMQPCDQCEDRTHGPCTSNIYQCDCDECADERELERARRYDTNADTL